MNERDKKSARAPQYLMMDEELRKVDCCKKMMDEMLGILHHDYGIQSFDRFRKMALQAKTFDEVRVAADMLLVVSRIHELARGE